MAAEVFAAPELAAMVAQHLSLRDIAACKLTSRAVNKAFNPYLWRQISTIKTTDKSDLLRILSRATRARVSGSLYRNRQHIETLSLGIFAAEYLCAILNITRADVGPSAPAAPSAPSAPAQKPAGTPSHPGFSSLKSLTVTIGALNDIYSSLDVKDKILPDEALITLLETAPNLTSLTLYPEVLGGAKFAATLDAGLPRLETFILRRPNGSNALQIPVTYVLPILQPLFSKSKLKTLELHFVMAYKRTLHSALVTKAMKELAKSPKVKSAVTRMVFPTGQYDLPSTFVNPIFKNCLPELQILNVPFIGDQAYSKFADTVRDHCPSVRELNLRNHSAGRDPRTMAEGVIRLIKACKDLRVYDGPRNGAYSHGDEIAQALHHHAATLETLLQEDGLRSPTMVELIRTMKALRTFIVSDRTSLNIKGAISVRWAHRHLRKLEWTIEVKDTTIAQVASQKLHLDPELNPGLPSGELTDEELGYVAMRKFFKQLGELTELEDVYIKHAKHTEWNLNKDWTLGVGLGFLSGLVKLRRLRLDYGLEHIGQAEVEFMHKHWLNLREVIFHGEEVHVSKYRQPWVWLKDRRPYLVYTYHTYARPKQEYNPFDQHLYCEMRCNLAHAFEFYGLEGCRSGTIDVSDTRRLFQGFYDPMTKPLYAISKPDAKRRRKTGTIASAVDFTENSKLTSPLYTEMYLACSLKKMLDERVNNVNVQKNLDRLLCLRQQEPVVFQTEERTLRSLLSLSLMELGCNISSINISITTVLVQKEHYERFAHVLESSLPQLKDLTLTSPRGQECVLLFQRFLRILQASCQKPLMTDLACDFSVSYSCRADATALNKTLRYVAQANWVLKKLRLPRSFKKGLSIAFLIPFLKTCVPHLETLTAPHVAKRDWHKLEATLKEHCPNLNHLCIDFSETQDSVSQQDEFYAGIIPFRQGLKGITFESNTPLFQIPRALLQHHAQTLQHIEFSSKAVISSKDIQQILTSCTALRTFIASQSTSTFLKLSDALESEWVCLGLEKLHLRLQSDRACLRRTLELGLDQNPKLNPKELNYTKGDMSAGYLAVRKLYQQVGRLRSLEELYLVQWGGFSNIHVMDWTLSEGLPYLKGLKNLRCLVMNYGYGQVQRADVEFMAKHWPELKQVKFMFLREVMLWVVGQSAH
ncbi:unnamed protein product [Mortierella alpina]